MNRIIRHTEYLLSRTDCVIIPGFGAVLARYECAKVDLESNIVRAPRRVFTFNSGLCHSDGALANSVARAEGIPHARAEAEIKSEVESMQRRLRSEGHIALGRIGEVFFDSDTRTSHFLSAAVDSISGDTAWLLPEIAQSATFEKKEKETPAPSNILEVPVRHQGHSAGRIARLVASIALLIGVCFIASTPIAIDDAALASFTPEIKHTPAEDFLPAEMEPVPSIDIIAHHNPDACIDTRSQADKARTSIGEIKALVDDAPAYLVIVASFATDAEASRHVQAACEASNGTKVLRFFESNGRWRVFTAVFPSEIEAYRHIASSSYGEAGAWVCKL